MPDELPDEYELMSEVYESAFKDGDKAALMQAVHKWLAAGRLPPAWATTALCEAIRRVQRYEAADWNEALGKPHHQKKITALRRERDMRWEILKRVTQLRRQRPKPPDIFSQVAAEMHISRATCKRFYERMYEFRKPPRFKKPPR
jgi:hypothetical protein